MTNNKVLIGYQGVLGSFGEQAAKEYFNKDEEKVNFKDFEDVFKALANDEIDYGVLPFENSSTGAIADVYDLVRKYGFYIVGERCLKIQQNLLAVPGTKLEDIKEVYSHIQAFLQSRAFLGKYPDWIQIPYFNTALSAKYIKESNCKTKAAIASLDAAELYGLDVICENINFNSNNITRFVVVSKQDESNEEADKISMVISLPHISGSLFSILKVFTENNINMLKIESRPDIKKPFEYYFYIDIEGNEQDDRVKKSLQEVEKISKSFKFLGNYKKDLL